MELISSLASSVVPQGSYFTEERLRQLERNFFKVSRDSYWITLEQFKKIVPSKNVFFIKRIFNICDENDSGQISIDQFIQLVRSIIGKPATEKLKFIFKVYDIDGDGIITPDEMRLVIKSCMEENGLDFSEEEISELAEVIFEEADNEKNKSIDFNQLKLQLSKYPGLIENLSINIERWLLPSNESKYSAQKMRMPNKLKWSHLKNNYVDVIFTLTFLMINCILFATRAKYYFDLHENYFTIFARACGQCLNFTCTFLVITMLRRSITFLRSHNFSMFLPLDHHIYYHKLTGWFVFIYSLIHSAMHIINFMLNWKSLNQKHGDDFSNIQYLFDPRATKSLGLISGYACITGWILLVILLIMIPLAQPCVRRSGKFEIFYFTHLLYIPWFIALIIHAPKFWIWFCVPGFIFLIELLRKITNHYGPSGLTYVEEGVLLPSKVVHLAIKRPENFNFQPGDYMFINVPSISRFEWHPFTISSAPEQNDVIWLHIRAVGEWTNALVDYFLIQELLQNALMNVGNRDVADGQNFCLPSQPLYRKSILNHQLVRKSIMKPPTRALINRKQEEQKKLIGQKNKMLTSMMLNVSNQTVPKTSLRRASTVFLFEKKKIEAPKIGDINEFMKDEVDACDVETGIKLRVPKRVVKRSIENRKTQVFSPEERVINTGRSLTIRLDGPYGSPSSRIFSAHHAVLIATGIGVTPFASILQSVMQRHFQTRRTCPNCFHRWNDTKLLHGMKLKKVDFVWINREQKSFEWFVNLLGQLELQQADLPQSQRILNIHMYVSSAADKSDIRTLGLQLALDLMHEKHNRCYITGLKSRTKPGRPNWDSFFAGIQEKSKDVTVFFCGAPQLARVLKVKCNQYSFKFRKEVF